MSLDQSVWAKTQKKRTQACNVAVLAGAHLGIQACSTSRAFELEKKITNIRRRQCES